MFQKGVQPVIKCCQLSPYQELRHLYDLLYLTAEDGLRSKIKKALRKKNPEMPLLVKTVLTWTDPIVFPESDPMHPLPLYQVNIWFKETALREKNRAGHKWESNACFCLWS